MMGCVIKGNGYAGVDDKGASVAWWVYLGILKLGFAAPCLIRRRAKTTDEDDAPLPYWLVVLAHVVHAIYWCWVQNRSTQSPPWSHKPQRPRFYQK